MTSNAGPVLIGSTRRTILAAGLAPLSLAPFGLAAMTGSAEAATAAQLDATADAALNKLYAKSVKAVQLSRKARAILIFPRITKAGFVIGGQGGQGVLRVHGRTWGYYQIAAASFGLQAGVQTFSYALFFITQSALDYVKASKGWAIGSGPSVVVADAGFAKTMNTTTLSQDVYAMPFGQTGLMAGLGIEGSKISRYTPSAT